MLSVAIQLYKLQKPFHDTAVILHIPDNKSQLVYMGHIRSRIHSYTTIFGFLTSFVILVVTSYMSGFLFIAFVHFRSI